MGEGHIKAEGDSDNPDTSLWSILYERYRHENTLLILILGSIIFII